MSLNREAAAKLLRKRAREICDPGRVSYDDAVWKAAVELIALPYEWEVVKVSKKKFMTRLEKDRAERERSPYDADYPGQPVEEVQFPVRSLDGIANCPKCDKPPIVSKHEKRQLPWYVWCSQCQYMAGGGDYPPEGSACGLIESDAIGTWHRQITMPLSDDKKIWNACAEITDPLTERHEELGEAGRVRSLEACVQDLGERLYQLNQKVDELLARVEGK